MEKKGKTDDKRKRKRFKVKDGAFTVLSYKPTVMGQIINMSEEGLAVTYKGKRLKKSAEIDLFISDAGFYLDQIPVKTVTDHKIAGKFLFRSEKIWQRSMQFGALTDDQQSQLDEFLIHYTSMMQRSEEDRRQFHDPGYTEPDRRNRIDRRDEGQA
jgi:hypothetical protein